MQPEIFYARIEQMAAMAREMKVELERFKTGPFSVPEKKLLRTGNLFRALEAQITVADAAMRTALELFMVDPIMVYAVDKMQEDEVPDAE